MTTLIAMLPSKVLLCEVFFLLLQKIVLEPWFWLSWSWVWRSLELSWEFFFFHGQFSQNENPSEKEGWPAVTSADDLSAWRTLLKEAVVAKAGGKLGEVEIFSATINCWFVHHVGWHSGFGFSLMANTPILLHDHNEVNCHVNKTTYCMLCPTS